MRVLCAGDLHLGRRPSRLPPHVDARGLSCASTWQDVVRYAIEQHVDVVALSGDLVDQSNKYFEAVGPLERGVRLLADAGIVTVAVAGNHDHDVLPQIARALPPNAFRLLGVGGRWQRITVERGAERLHVDGWSFPAEHVDASPLRSYPAAPAGDTPVLGLLHADLGTTSRYAPVPLADLQAMPVALWLLGHVHAPALHEQAGCPPVLYPGSPQPMDPGEPGIHGVWLVDLRPGQPARPKPVPLASVRYETVVVDVDGIADVASLRASVNDQVRAAVAGMLCGGALRHLVLRLRLTGSTPIHGRIDRELRSIVEDFDRDEGNVAVCVEQATAETRPARDLDELAKGSDAVAVLARIIRTIEADPAQGPASELLADATRVASILRDARPYARLGDDDDMAASTLRATVARQASLLLEELLAQKAVRA